MENSMLGAERNPIRFIWLFYLACFAVRIIEYFFIRTDQGIIGEAFIHKLIGIGLLAATIWYLGYKWSDIGFRASDSLKGICTGLLFGSIIMSVAYGSEMLIQYFSGNSPSLQFYVTSYTIDGNRAIDSSILFVLICIAGNIINVVMEEGVFRGLFTRLAEQKYSFLKACIFTSLLFGFWHIAAPLRNVIDGGQSPMGAFMMGLMLVGTSALAGIQYVMLLKITGSLWAPMAFHFVNNASVNLLHVVTVSDDYFSSQLTQADELQTVRLTIAGTLSFIVVLIIFIRGKKSRYGEIGG